MSPNSNSNAVASALLVAAGCYREATVSNNSYKYIGLML